MKAIDSIVQSKQSPHVYMCRFESRIRFYEYLKSHYPTFYISIIDGYTIKDGFYEMFKYRFKFPSYFSGNMNSFFDIMWDLSWIKSEGFITIIFNSEYIYDNHREDFDEILRIFEVLGQEWARDLQEEEVWDRRPTSFYLFLLDCRCIPSMPGVGILENWS